ncbi:MULTISPECIES: AEC family transporter [Sphingobacterium]|uniref:AEC family transporter n=1 Tax=Sphingobacterium TaxID=28453 RepID=UPI0013D8F892|nr:MULTISPECIES: AEC family transporter [unclassified Sphingobacterium]
MVNFFIIVICLFVGFLFRRFKLASRDSYKIVNNWIIYVGLPAIALLYIPKIDWNLGYLFTALLPFFIFGLSYLFFQILQYRIGFSSRTLTTLIIVSGLSNTSFVGFPLIISFFGSEQLKVGVVSDQATFFVLSSFAVLLATNTRTLRLNSNQKWRLILRRIITFPPFLAAVIALVFQEVLQQMYFEVFFSSLAATVSPLALFSIGLQLHFQRVHKEMKAISLSLFYKLLFAPAVALLIAFVMGWKGVFFQVSVFEMAMPSLVASGIVIQNFGLNSKLANTIIGVSILLGLILSFLWHSVIITLL